MCTIVWKQTQRLSVVFGRKEREEKRKKRKDKREERRERVREERGESGELQGHPNWLYETD